MATEDLARKEQTLKSLTLFLQQVLSELGTRCHVSTTRDYKTVLGRIEHEGLSFLTITLANFGSDFQKSLDQGFVGHDQFPGFARTGSLPRFLGGFFDRVFDRSGGLLLEDPDIAAIHAIRQITLMFAKIGLDCSDERIKKAISGYLKCEQEVRDFDGRLSPSDKLDFVRVSSLLWRDLFASVENKLYAGEYLPKHGPGATADRLKGNRKYDQVEWPERLEKVFPWIENAAASWSQYQDLDQVDFLEPGRERPVRVITVPKTLKTPRIIAIEPTAMQYMQQAILEMFEEGVAEDDFSANLIRWDDQTPNQRLAREGSITGLLATLDMSEASDRVSNQHVRLMLERWPLLLEAVDATRSRKADVPGTGVIRLSKFASMGSALCFPIEAMVFCTVIFLGIEKQLSRHLTRKDIQSFFGKVRVYGDDIVVPVEYAESVNTALRTFGFKVNSSKSFWTGKFRESCGRDYYDGTDVSIVRVRSLFPTSRRDCVELISTVSLRNQLRYAGYGPTVEWLDRQIERLIPFPIVAPTSSALGRHEFGLYQSDSYDPDTQSPLVKAIVPKVKIPENRASGYGSLLKMYLKRGLNPFETVDHLIRSGRPFHVDINERMVSPF